MAISFKSVGKTREARAAEALNSSPTPIDVVTPLRFSSDDLFVVHYSLAESVHNNLRNLLLTNWGERLGMYSYGANLRPLLSEFVSQEDFDAQCAERISSAVSKWMPYISLESFESSIDRIENQVSNGTAVVVLTVFYSIPSLNVTEKAIEVRLYAM